MNKFYFTKIERPVFRGLDALRHFRKMMLFLEILSITVRNISFLEYLILEKSFKRCPRYVKIALGISGDDGEG